jgi:hypothetical protein
MITPLKIVFVGCVWFAFYSEGLAQDKMLSKHLFENMHNWREGRVFLADGTELTGLLRYDDKAGILTYQNGDVSKTLIAKSAAGFEFYDEELKRDRYFFSLEYSDEKTPNKFYFFEVLRELNHFAVLSKVDPIEIEIKSSGSSGYMDPAGGFTPGMSYQHTEVHQTETIFIMDRNGAVSPYLKILDRDIGGVFARKRTKNRFVDEDLLSIYTGRYYQQLEDFADKKDLSFKRKEDLLVILDYYLELP